MIDAELIKILACPACKGSVQQLSDEIVCDLCKCRYPVCDGIPILLIDEAQGGN